MLPGRLFLRLIPVDCPGPGFITCVLPPGVVGVAGAIRVPRGFRLAGVPGWRCVRAH